MSDELANDRAGPLPEEGRGERPRRTTPFYLHSGPFEIICIALLIVMILTVLMLPVLQWIRHLIRQW
jgi:hypothetical protein